MISRYFTVILLIAGSRLLALEAQFQADSLQGSLGDIISFSWLISHTPDEVLTLADYELDGSGIEVLDQHIIPIKDGSQLHFKTAVYDSIGLYRFPILTLFAEAEGHIDSLLLSGPELEIRSILSARDTTFRDIKGLHRIRTPFNIVTLLIILGSCFLIYVIYYVVKRLHKSKSNPADVKVIIPPEEAHIIALRALEALKRSKYLRFEQYKEFHSELTHILKTYYENRFLIDALELTTSELIDKIQSMSDFDKPFVDDTSQILTKADIIKFAKAPSNELESGEALKAATNIVKRTKIQTNQEKTRD
ncbi:MAG: hypothetical protein HQ508_05615 [Candidatus Marinimicrobia bacterium]|nr:hypothetical protein [Candidatus Neomarinimicrobiota bacterium]